MSHQIALLMAKLKDSGIEAAWFGSGINSVYATQHVVPDKEALRDLCRVIYSTGANTQLLPSMVLLSELSGMLRPKVALIGSWAHKMCGFSEAVESMAAEAEVKIIVLHMKDAVQDFVFPHGWCGAWIGIKPLGYILSCVRSCTLSSSDISKELKDLVGKKWKDPKPVAETVADPFSSLTELNGEDKKKVKDVLEKKDKLQFVDVSKKRPLASDEILSPGKSSRIVMTCPELDVPKLLGGSDVLTAMGYESGSVNVSLLTPGQQLVVCGKTVPLSIGAILLEVAVAFRNYV